MVDETETDEETRKPCGEYHPLPCGLDKACPVPVEYFDASKDSEAIWEAFQHHGSQSGAE